MPTNTGGSAMFAVVNPDGTLVGSGSGGPITIGGQPIQVVQSSLGASLHNNTSTTAPTAGTAVATVTLPAAGTYRIVVNLMLGGTGVPVTPNNYRLQVGAQPTIALFAPVEKSLVYSNELVVTGTSGNAVQVQTVVNEVAAVVVGTSLNVYRVV